jgi:hypothetical protein
MPHPARVEYHRCELWGYFGTAYLSALNVEDEDDDEDENDCDGLWHAHSPPKILAPSSFTDY